MIKRRNPSLFVLLCLLLLPIFLNINYNYNNSSLNNVEFPAKNEIVKSSGSYNEKVIVFFNRSSYNNSITSTFKYYGGIIKKEWNNLFSSISGFAGIISNEQNKTLFQEDFPEVNIENDEILTTQMNYASIQSGAFNLSWFENGYKGNTNSSVAVIDTGINPNHYFFPKGYSPSNFSGNIIGWDNFVNTDPISDKNGHGTFISSIISGTGQESQKSNKSIIVKINEYYSHSELFDEYSPTKNYSLKIFSFNASKPDSVIFINSTWKLISEGINQFWFELFYNNTLVRHSTNMSQNVNYFINYTIPQNQLGIYNLYLKYHKLLQKKPIFSFNSSIRYFPENYIENSTYFTGIANATKLVAYKILNQSGIGYTSDLITALAHVIHNRSIYHIISVCLSIGTIGEDVKAINRVIDEVIKSGVLVVIAAGNFGIETSKSLNKLAINKNAIVVGATNDKDQVTSYTSMGRNIGNVIKPDILAPGGSKLANHRTVISADVETNKITTAYGTSIATAIVAASINLLIEARWRTWNQWDTLNLANWVKYIKSTLLMTASETNMEREDDPNTLSDERNYSPTISFSPLVTGLKDIHEGYGRVNIHAAIDALTKNIDVGNSISKNLVSSKIDPLGNHVFARKINLTEDDQYLFNLSIVGNDAEFDMFLYSNISNRYGEPILLESSRKWYANNTYFYFTPKENETNCIIVIKAIEGGSFFTLNISEVANLFPPVLKIPEINYLTVSKNTTILSLQEALGGNPKKNYSIDSYSFYIDYFDNDTSNVPPQGVYVSIVGLKNYSLSQLYPFDINYTDGALFVSDYIQFKKSGLFQYFFVTKDGNMSIRFPTKGFFNISIEFPTDSVQFPSKYSFNEGIGNWTTTGTGWNSLFQSNNIDNRSRIYQDYWSSLYFGMFHNYPENYTYQPVNPSENHYPNGSLTSPLFNLTQLNKNNTQPIARFGSRVSINTGDFIILQVNLNWTGWFTIKVYTGEESDWFIETVNLTAYIGYFVQFRFGSVLDNTPDPLNYKGFILDFFSIINFTNNYAPQIKFALDTNIPITQDSILSHFTFTIEYYDLDNNYPEFVYLEMGNTNYSMYNFYGDWNASSNSSNDFGIIFNRALILEDISNLSFRFHVSDGKYSIKTERYNENNTLFMFINPTPLLFNIYQDNKYIGYSFSNNNLSDYYITGSPTPKESTIWLGGDNTWHIIKRFGQKVFYGGEGQSWGGINQGYGINWEANLITKNLRLSDEYPVYLEYDYDILLQNEVFQPEDQLDRCIVSISTNFGDSWTILKEYTYESEILYGTERIDLFYYSNSEVMIKFTLRSNNIEIGLGFGWLLSNIYIGYDKSTDFIAPKIEILNPKNGTTINSKILIEANITDNIKVDDSRIYVFLNGKSIERTKIAYNTSTGILKVYWDVNKYNDGNYELKIVAYDKEGNIAEKVVKIKLNTMKWWRTWSPYIILIISVTIAGILIYFYLEKKGKFQIKQLRDNRAEKIRLREINKNQVVKKIELINKEDELKRSLTLYCKYCKSWFSSKDFDIICPKCDNDQIFVAYLCENCNKWIFKDEPREDFYCKHKKCKGIRLIRREKAEIKNFLAQKGNILREFKKKIKKFSILDGMQE